MRNLNLWIGMAAALCLAACGSDSDSSSETDAASCTVPDGPGIVEPIDDTTQAANCQAACTWLASCSVNTGACTGYVQCDAEAFQTVYDRCAMRCAGPSGSALLQLAKDHTMCSQSIELAGMNSECSRARCAPNASPDDEVAACQPAAGGAAAPTGPQTIAAIAQSTENVSTLLGLISMNAPDLVTGLSDPEKTYTVFAPTNEAFAKLSAVPEGEVLLNILNSHLIVNKAYKAADLMNDMDLGTNGTGRIKVAVSAEGAVTLTMGDVTANVVAPDVEASNGVVHLIDAVLIPAAN
ncbi:MAG: fasciclin domain-containing protein [Myxococcota bacterium]|nr:fasciclin domain-containing protein [Myxococcota bacterium]